MGSSIGVDIGTSGVRVVEVSTNTKSVTVKRVGAIPLAPGVIEDGVIVNTGAVATALRTLWRQHRFRSRKVRLTMSSYQQVLIRMTTIQHIEDGKHAAGLVRNAASTAMPVDVDGLIMSHQVIGLRDVLDEEDRPQPKADILLTGAHKDAVDSYVTAVEAAGLHPVDIDVTAFALARFVAPAGSGRSRIDFILHMGAETVLLIGLRGSQFVSMTAMDHLSGNAITQAVVEAVGLSTSDAEHLKVTAQTGSPLRPGADVIEPLLASWTDAIVRETKDSIAAQSHAVGLAVGRVWVSGGGAGLPSITPRLGAEIGGGTSVAYLDPTTWVPSPGKLQRASESTNANLTVALATALQ